LAFHGLFTPVLAKHLKSFSLADTISVGMDRMQRNFEPMRKQVEAWRQTELSDVAAKMIIYGRRSLKASSKRRNTSLVAFPHGAREATATSISWVARRRFGLIARCGYPRLHSLTLEQWREQHYILREKNQALSQGGMAAAKPGKESSDPESKQRRAAAKKAEPRRKRRL
jgi:hypothetical protein